MYAGCGVGDINDVPTAGAIVERITQQARAVMSQAAE
jgi:hypothetical protein